MKVYSCYQTCPSMSKQLLLLLFGHFVFPWLRAIRESPWLHLSSFGCLNKGRSVCVCTYTHEPDAFVTISQCYQALPGVYGTQE